MKAIFGLPGTGKTTLLTAIAIKALKKGMYEGESIERVYTNFAVNYPGIYRLDWSKLGYQQHENCLILIDEISIYCDNRNWKENLKKEQLMFWKLYRHYRCQIIYCSQSYNDCDKKIRDLTDEFYQITALPFGLSRLQKISREMIIDKTIQEGYNLRGLGRIYFRPRYYKYFDSYSAPQLKPNTSKTWIQSENDIPSESHENAPKSHASKGKVIILPTLLERQKRAIDTQDCNKTEEINGE